MGAIVAADVTVTFERKDMSMMRCRNEVKIVFGDGSVTYPANGIPLPAKNQFGMHAVLARLLIYSNPANGYVYSFDPAHYTLRIWIGPTTEFSGAISATTLYADAWGQ